eukprot:12424724-Karenia_brevis.AAC.1
MKQNRVHTVNAKGECVPLLQCRRPDDPTKGKGDFRCKWLISQAVVLCNGLLKMMDMPSSGRRNKLGSFHGPQNGNNLNGTHPALSACLQCNSDVRLPYRLPICDQSHSPLCRENCLDKLNYAEMLEAAQTSQDAQAGCA